MGTKRARIDISKTRPNGGQPEPAYFEYSETDTGMDLCEAVVTAVDRAAVGAFCDGGETTTAQLTVTVRPRSGETMRITVTTTLRQGEYRV